MLKIIIFSLFFLSLLACSGSDPGTPPDRPDLPDPDLGMADMVDEMDMEMDADPVEPDAAGPSVLGVDPTFVQFQNVEIGGMASETIALTNTGASSLQILGLRWTQAGRTEDLEFRAGEDWPQTPHSLEAGTFIEFTVVYQPDDERSDIAVLHIDTDADEGADQSVRFETISPYAEIDVIRSVRFGSVARDEEETERLFIYNRGSTTLSVQDVSYNGNGRFDLVFPFEVPPVFLARGEALAVDVVYSPNNTNPDRGTITIASDDPVEPNLAIAVAGNEPTPCVSVAALADLGTVAPGANASTQIAFANCAELLTLEIASVAITDGDDVFEIVEPDTIPTVLLPRQSATFEVRGFALEPGERTGRITIETNDPEDRVVELRLLVEN